MGSLADRPLLIPIGGKLAVSLMVIGGPVPNEFHQVVKRPIAVTQQITILTNMAREIYNRIAMFRADSGMSRRALANVVGVNPQTIGFLERGDYKPSLELALAIVEHFGVSVEHVFSFEPFPSLSEQLKRGHDNGE